MTTPAMIVTIIAVALMVIAAILVYRHRGNFKLKVSNFLRVGGKFEGRTARLDDKIERLRGRNVSLHHDLPGAVRIKDVESTEDITIRHSGGQTSQN